MASSDLYGGVFHIVVQGEAGATAVPVSGPVTDAQLRATAVAVLPSAQEVHLGQVGGTTTMITVTPTLDTNIYADGDILFNPVAIPAAVRVAGGTAILQDVVVYDLSDQGIAFDILIMTAATSLGTINSAPNIADDNATDIIARFSSIDFYDMGAFRVGTLSNLAKVVKAVAGTTSLYAAGISRGAGTYAAAGLKLTFGLLQD